jgi:hypothetical protein
MTTMSAPPTQFDVLTDDELESELTLAALSARREARFNALLDERLRRHERPVINRDSVAPESLAAWSREPTPTERERRHRLAWAGA